MGKRDHGPGKLVAVTLKKLDDGWHADGGNLYLFVRGNSRTWVFRYTGPDGKRKNMGLGSLEAVPLTEARKHAAELRSKIKHPIAPADPLLERQQAKAARRLERAKGMTFKACALAYMDAKRSEWKNPKHAQQWENTLEAYAYPVFGNLPVAALDEGLVVKCLKPIWESKTETATRLRGRIESILDWAATSKFRQGENPARWKGRLENLLATPSKIKKVEHHAALPYSELGTFMVELKKREGMGARALEFAIMTAARSGEIRGATWAEIDLDKKIWTIPAGRMKAKKEHRVPLSDDAVKLLEALPRIEGVEYVFPSARSGGGSGSKPLSDMTLTSLLRRMDADRQEDGEKGWRDSRTREVITAHGFRSTFRDWAGECTNYPREVAEMALAHVIENAVEAAYRRGDLFEKRRRMMDDWATYCGTVVLEADNVVPIRGAA